MLNYFLFINFSLICILKTEDVFTSMADITTLLMSKREYVAMLKKYLNDEKDRILKIQSFIEDHEDQMYQENDVEHYLSNPINAFLLIKSLTKDWRSIEEMMRISVSEAYIDEISNNIFLPGEEDLNGAARALIRLQDIYKVDTKQMACGDIPGLKTSPNLNAEQCFEIGRQSYLNEDYYHTRLWMEEAIRKWEEEPADKKSILKEDILEYLAFSEYKQGNVTMALTKTHELLEINPNHDRALGNVERYKQEIEGLQKLGQKVNETVITNTDDLDYVSNYHSLCRGDYPRDQSKIKKLKCRYVNRHKSPLLTLSPAKEETLSYKPWIVRYHDVINDREVEILKESAYPKLKQARLVDSTDQVKESDWRTCKIAWLNEKDHQIVKDINGRISSITGLSMTTAEDLQVANYGIGGHYGPHYDFIREYEEDFDDRIATWMFYLSDVIAGGATVFPLVGIRSAPIKNSAVFWYNLKASGAQDFDTYHTACPVLAGYKWVANKWIHERDQEFRRPCKLNPSL